MRISYDPRKREKTLAERGLDFEEASEVFNGDVYEEVDDRRDYGEVRWLAVGCATRTAGDGRLDASRRLPSHHLDEKVQ
jgi:uncharacterized DUF497 family protein